MVSKMSPLSFAWLKIDCQYENYEFQIVMRVATIMCFSNELNYYGSCIMVTADAFTDYKKVVDIR